MTTGSHADCTFEFTGDELTIANRVLRRKWKLHEGALLATSFVNLITKTEWFAPAKTPIHSPFVTATGQGEAKVDIAWSDRPLTPVQQADTLVVTLSVSRGGTH